MLATAAVRYRPDWQPDPFACIAAGVVATAVLLAALVSIFSRQPQSDLQAAAVKIRIGPVTDARSMAVKKILQPRHRTGRLADQNRTRQAAAEKPPLQTVKTILPKSLDWQRQIDLAVKAYAQHQTNPPEFVLQQHPPPDMDLWRALQTLRKLPVMRDGEAYRSVYGSAVVKSGGVCSELHRLQLGLSPSNTITLGLYAHCPGDYRPGMGEQLLDWAEHRRAQPGAPP